MNTYILINYTILAVLFTFLLVEGMSAVSLIYDRKSLPAVKRYLDPIWGIVGTFAVFFVVNSEVLYPQILPNIDYLYVFPILLATFLFIARNVSLVFSEYIWKDSKFSQLTLARIYSLVTILIFVILLTIFISIISGTGVNSALTSFSAVSFLSNYYDLLFILGVVLVVFGMTFVFYKLERLKALSPVTSAAGLLLLFFSMRGLGIFFNYISYMLAVIIVLISIIYFLTGKMRRELIFIVFFLSVLSINLLNYGKVFGTHDLQAYLNNSAVSSASFIVTIIGGFILTGMLL
ncbi:MAG: hypothetical protein OH316_02475, partial [Candidatus Parvarchaeota archaeon]|nr:hypothetical protein [Candidatus Parvarchaeota archaeon]